MQCFWRPNILLFTKRSLMVRSHASKQRTTAMAVKKTTKARGRVHRRVTVRDVAKHAEVSVTTVSYVLNKRGSIGEETRQRVLKAAKKLGYQQNRAAQSMKTGRSNILGLVFPNIVNPFFASLAQSVLLEAQRKGYQVFLVDTEGSYDNEKRAVQGLIQQGVDGIVVFPVDDSDSFLEGGLDVPVVVLDRDVSNVDLVQAEYYAGGQMIAEYLQGLGHKKFGMLDGPQVVASARARSKGFVDGLGKGAKLVWRLEQAYEMDLTEEALDKLDASVTAIVCGNDLIAIATILALRSRGIAVPEDVSVVGFDDILFASKISPTLTTIRMPADAMGIEAVNLLKRRLDGDTAVKARNRVVLNVELVERGSTAPPPG